MNTNDIGFPNLGFIFHNVPSGFTIFGVEIKLYAIMIVCGGALAYFTARHVAKKSEQNPEDYLDYLLIGMIPALLGARAYYVLFRLDAYFQAGQTPLQTLIRILDIRQGGLAIYGGLIGAAVVALIFAKRRKLSALEMLDTIFVGVPIAQAVGRLGNFFNREAFGAYTNNLLAMAIPVDYYQTNGIYADLVANGNITEEMLLNQVDGCIRVAPTFFYEGAWNVALFVILLLVSGKKKFNGQLLAIYLFGYGLGRFWIEGLRTDSLMVGNTGLRASQVLALILMVVAVAYVLIQLIYHKKNGKWLFEHHAIPAALFADKKES